MQNQLTISNTDVITMLVVKNREKLNEELNEVTAKMLVMEEEMSKKVRALYQKQLKKINPKIIEAYEALLKALNPKIPFTLQIGDKYEYIDFNNGIYRGCIEHNCHYEFIYPVVTKEEQEDNFIFGGDSDSLNIPVKINFKYNLPKEYIDLSIKRDKIKNLLKNENNLKEKLIAQVTENALQNMPELSYLTTDIQLISLNQ